MKAKNNIQALESLVNNLSSSAQTTISKYFIDVELPMNICDAKKFDENATITVIDNTITLVMFNKSFTFIKEADTNKRYDFEDSIIDAIIAAESAVEEVVIEIIEEEAEEATNFEKIQAKNESATVSRTDWFCDCYGNFNDFEIIDYDASDYIDYCEIVFENEEYVCILENTKTKAKFAIFANGPLSSHSEMLYVEIK